MADDAERTEGRTNAIERVYNRAINKTLELLHNAIEEANTYTLPSQIVESQQAYIARLRQLHKAVEEGAKNPLGEFNWDWL